MLPTGIVLFALFRADGGVPPRPPSPLQERLLRECRSDPLAVLIRLSGEISLPLNATQKQDVVRQALDHLAQQVDRGDAAGLDKRLRQVAGLRIEAPYAASYQAIRQRLTHRLLRRSLGELAALHGKPPAEAVTQARQWLGGPLARAGDGLPATEKLRGTILTVSHDLDKMGTGLALLDRLRVALRRMQGGTAHPRELLRFNATDLPAEAVALRDLAQLATYLEARNASPPLRAEVDRCLNNVQTALGRLPGGATGDLVQRVRQDLAFLALLEGHPAAFREMWPADGPPEHAARLLRELKTLLKSAGKAGEATSRLVSAERLRTWKPPAGDRENPGLTALDLLVRKAHLLAEAALTSTATQRALTEKRIRTLVGQLAQMDVRLTEQEQDESEKRKTLEKRLGQPVPDAERLVVWARLHDGARLEELLRDQQARLRAGELALDLARVLAYLDPAAITNEHIALARKLLAERQDVAEVVERLADALPERRRTVPGGIRLAVRGEEIARQVGSPLDGFEQAHVRHLLNRGESSATIVQTIQKERRRVQVQRDLERVKGYLDRTATPAELAQARQLLEAGKDVAEAVTALSGALSEARRTVPGGVETAVRLDEIRHALGNLDSFEQAQARELLRRGRRPIEVVTALKNQRAAAAEQELQRRLRLVSEHFRGSAIERIVAEPLLRAGMNSEEVIALLQAVIRALDQAMRR